MKHLKKLTMTLALAFAGVLASWAQDEYVTVDPTANANEWTLQMPAADVELEIEYEPDYYVVGTMNSWDGGMSRRHNNVWDEEEEDW